MRFTDIKSVSDMKEMMDSMPKFSEVGLKAARFGLDAMNEVCGRLGSPHMAYPTIHVAGTNGKGTTCRLLASSLKEAGFKTGLTTSPHLVTMHERIRINDSLITDEEMLRFFRLHGDVLDEVPLTYFELTICIAFWHFAEHKVDIAVVETGLGGRLDATNIITPLCSIITSIGFDHTDVLGPRLQDIAAEKAGIIKPRVPVVVGDLPDEAESVIRQVAVERSSAFIKAMDEPFSRVGDRYEFTFRGEPCSADASLHPVINTVNSAMVRSALDVIGRGLGLSIPRRAFVRGIERFFDHFPVQGHAQCLFADRDWYFDGAHNPQALGILRRELARKAPLDQWTIVFAIMKDKLNHDVLSQLAGFGRLYVMPMESPRAATLEEIRSMYAEVVASASDPASFPRLRLLEDPGQLDATEDSSQLDATEDPAADATSPASVALESLHRRSELVIFTGSFYFYSNLMAWKQLHPPLP